MIKTTTTKKKNQKQTTKTKTNKKKKPPISSDTHSQYQDKRFSNWEKVEKIRIRIAEKVTKFTHNQEKIGKKQEGNGRGNFE